NGLLLHVPVSPQSHGGLLQLQTGQGWLTAVASVMIAFNGMMNAVAPVWRLYVPVTSPLKRNKTQIGTPPPESGTGAPYRLITQLPAPTHCVFSVQLRLGSPEQNEPTLAKKVQS